MQLYPDIIIIVIAILVLYLLYRNLYGNYVSADQLEHFSSEISAEAIQNVAAIVDQNFVTMPFMIVIFRGAADMIPDGWALCNGQNGTPDLRDRFVVGAGPRKRYGTRGGGNTVLSIANLPSHSHSVVGSTDADWSSHSCASDDGGGQDSHYTLGDSNAGRRCPIPQHRHRINLISGRTGFGRPFTADPLYYSLSYIMKLPPNTNA